MIETTPGRRPNGSARVLFALLTAICAAGCAWPPAPTPNPGDRPTAPLGLPSGVAAVTPRPGGRPVILATPPARAEAGPGAAGLGDAFYPGLGNGGYDALDYTIDLAVDVDANTIAGATAMVARATQNLSAFNLDLFGLDVSAATVDGQQSRFERAGSELSVTPAQPLAAGAVFTCVIAYRGAPSVIADSGIPRIPLGWQTQTVGTFVASEPSGAMNWFPSNNHPSDKATYTFRITAPRPYRVAANGVLMAITAGDRDATATYVWRMNQPMASYLATVHIGLFDTGDGRSPTGTPIRNYFPTSTPESVRRQFDGTGEMMAFLEGLVGPYPFDAYGVVLLSNESTWALEAQSLSIFGARGSSEETIVHELAHQWFGDSVTPARWQDTWINEGFATYLAAMWMEKTRGSAYFESEMRSYYATLSGGTFGPPYYRDVGEMFGTSVYLRGALALHALRVMAGEAVFRQVLRGYYARYRNSIATTDDFLAAVAEYAGTLEAEALRPWIYDEALPAFPR